MNVEVANRLQQLRKAKGLSQEELANILGLSRQAISKWERAETSPDTDNLICLARLYNISIDKLLDTSESTEEIKERIAQERIDEISNESKEESNVNEQIDSDEKVDDDDSFKDQELTEEEKALKEKRNRIEANITFAALALGVFLFIFIGWKYDAWSWSWALIFVPIFLELYILNLVKKDSSFFNLLFAIFLIWIVVGGAADESDKVGLVFALLVSGLLIIELYFCIITYLIVNYKDKSNSDSLNQKEKFNKLNEEHRRQIEKYNKKYMDK